MLPGVLFGLWKNGYCPPPPYSTAGADAACVLYTVGCRIPYCATLLTLLLRQTLPVFFIRFGYANLYCATPPYTTVGADAARCFVLSACWATLHCATPYTTPMLNAACFKAMSIGVLGDPSLRYFTLNYATSLHYS